MSQLKSSIHNGWSIPLNNTMTPRDGLVRRVWREYPWLLWGTVVTLMLLAVCGCLLFFYAVRLVRFANPAPKSGSWLMSVTSAVFALLLILSRYWNRAGKVLLTGTPEQMEAIRKLC